MPAWKTDLPDGKAHMGFELRRTPRAGALTAIVTSESFVVCDTHYWGGRTMPCERRQSDQSGQETAGDCPACNAATPFRTHVYVSAFDPKSRDHFLFECTVNAAKSFQEYKASAKTLRGCIFNARRSKESANGKVTIETNTANLARVTLPSEPNVIDILCVIWRIPLKAKTTWEDQKPRTNARVDAAMLERQRLQESNAPDPMSLGDILNYREKQVENGNGSKVPL